MPKLRFEADADFDSNRQLSAAVRTSICAYADAIASTNDIVSDLDRASMRHASDHIPVLFKALSTTVRLAFPYDTAKSEVVFLSLAQLMLECFAVGGSSVLSEEAEEFKAKMRALQMRASKQEKAEVSSEEIAIRQAIAAELKKTDLDGLSDWQKANSILSAVNRRIGEKGYAPINLDKIRRRISKLDISALEERS